MNVNTNKRGIVFFLAFLFTTSVTFATTPTNWQNAQWIWQQEEGPSNTWMSFRKTITVEELPEIVEAHIAVDSKFWLWINDEMVIFEGGLSRGPSQAGEWNRKEKITFNSYVLSWLINGELDRVAYFVAKNNKQIKQLEEAKNLKVVKDYGGYKIFKRELK